MSGSRTEGTNRLVNAHRFAYELLVGLIPVGLQIDHLCRNPSCCNPTHMEPVLPTENLRRGFSPSALNARKTHCKHGHEFTEENTYIRPSTSGWRVCKECARLAHRESYWAQRHMLTLQEG